MQKRKNNDEAKFRSILEEYSGKIAGLVFQKNGIVRAGRIAKKARRKNKS